MFSAESFTLNHNYIVKPHVTTTEDVKWGENKMVGMAAKSGLVLFGFYWEFLASDKILSFLAKEYWYALHFFLHENIENTGILSTQQGSSTL